jgi:uncharacterized membrane protein
MLFLHILAAITLGLLVGVELTVAAFLNPILWRLDDLGRSSATRLAAIRFGKAMPPWYALGLVLLIAEAVLHRHQPSFNLLLVASILWAAVIVTTLLFLVPINNRLARNTNPILTDEETRQHRDWDSLHRLRVAAVAAVYLSFLIAILR